MISTLLAGVFGAVMLKVPKYYRLTRYGVAAEGSITTLEPYNHASVIYMYQVRGRTYTGGGHAGDIYADFDQLGRGQKVPVFYRPDKEGVSCLGDPEKHLYSLLRGSAFIMTFPTLFLFALKIRGFWK